jgi:two-component system, chemotaxis family, protein-glutamate methylesterase/glutaminase
MKEIRVLIIDPNVTIRLALSGIIKQIEGALVAGAYNSENLKNSLEVIKESKPSVIMIGIDNDKSKEMKLFLSIREKFPRLPVVVITPIDMEGAVAALKALRKGAVDYITKPVKRSGSVLARQHFMKRVTPLLKAIPRLNLDFLVSTVEIQNSVKKVEQVSTSYFKRSLNPVEIVVISGCTGGVHSLYPLISSLPDAIPVPVIILQHMPKIYTKMLAEELDQITPLNVREARNNSVLLPGQVYVGPGGYHVEIRNNGYRKTISLHRGPREQKHRPSINVLLRSVSQIYKDKAMGVILSGLDTDGMKGVQSLVDAGGQVLILHKNSSLLWDLPGKIEELGNYAGMYPVKQMGFEIIRRIKSYSDSKPSKEYRSKFESFQDKSGNRNHSDYHYL